MGVFDFFRKKKDDDLDLSAFDVKDESPGIDQPKFEEEEFKPAFPETTSFNRPSPPSQNGMSSTDVQLILTKLDLINQRLENMDRRLQIIEQLAKQ
ncbi:MAG: hypothetical protein WC595_01630 [Candidatus Nanoarchaeia archaeon]